MSGSDSPLRAVSPPPQPLGGCSVWSESTNAPQSSLYGPWPERTWKKSRSLDGKKPIALRWAGTTGLHLPASCGWTAPSFWKWTITKSIHVSSFSFCWFCIVMLSCIEHFKGHWCFQNPAHRVPCCCSTLLFWFLCVLLTQVINLDLQVGKEFCSGCSEYVVCVF